jgi:hypothetical protein
MMEEYRLVYSGEVADGQHAAVVKKRLSTVLKLDDKRMEVLFSGKAVVVKKATDEKTAARYQQVFEKAGAKLRVLPLADSQEERQDEPVDEPKDGSIAGSPSAAPEQLAPQTSAPATAMDVLPHGSDLLRDDERKQVDTPEIATDHLSVQGSVLITDEPEDIIDVPDVDHISLAELGAMLGNVDGETLLAEIDTDFDLAEVGALLREADLVIAAELSAPDADFSVADVGADLDSMQKAVPPPAPDTSHIELEDDDSKKD